MNIRRFLVLLAFLCAAPGGKAQTLDEYNNTLQKIYEYYNRNQPDSIYTLFSDRLKDAAPAGKFIQKIKDLRARAGNMINYRPVVEKEGLVMYTTTFEGTVLSLLIKIDLYNAIDVFRFVPLQADTNAVSKSNFFLGIRLGNIYGTLSEPPGIRKVPVVIIIPGAGPVDRNGNNPYGLNANTYSMIADSLQKRGIACLRYDKRGVAESAAALRLEDDLTFDDFIDDAAGFVTRLKQYWRFDKVFILGHGDGALIGMKVAERVKVDGMISISGVSMRGDKLIESQIKPESKKLAKRVAAVFDSLNRGYEITPADSVMKSIFNVSIQTYLKSWAKYDPVEAMKKMTIPTLIIQGTADLQTNKKDGKKLKDANPQAALIYLEGMNYVMKQAPNEKDANVATYANDKLPLSPGLIPAIADFVKSH